MIHPKHFMQIARELATSSHCKRKNVGAIAIRDGRIISTGINGTLPGMPNCDDVFASQDMNNSTVHGEHHIFSKKYEIHAEENLILFAAKSGITLDGCTVYCTLRPCWHCLRGLIGCGVKSIIFDEEHESLLADANEMHEYAKLAGVNLVKLGDL